MILVKIINLTGLIGETIKIKDTSVGSYLKYLESEESSIFFLLKEGSKGQDGSVFKNRGRIKGI